MRENVWIPLRDGVRPAAKLWLPEGAGPDDDVHYWGGTMFARFGLTWAAHLLACDARPPDVSGPDWRRKWLERLQKPNRSSGRGSATSGTTTTGSRDQSGRTIPRSSVRSTPSAAGTTRTPNRSCASAKISGRRSRDPSGRGGTGTRKTACRSGPSGSSPKPCVGGIIGSRVSTTPHGRAASTAKTPSRPLRPATSGPARGSPSPNVRTQQFRLGPHSRQAAP